jgi:hypothetical protein
MKRILIAALLILGTVGIFAQAGTWYFAILPGYSFNSSGSYYNAGWYAAKAEGKDNFVGSLDGAYFFNDTVGLHFAYLYNPGNAKLKLYDYTNYGGSGYVGEFGFDRNINVLQIGPEFVWGSKENQGYAQINLGWTFGSGNTDVNIYGHHYDLGNVGSNDFTYGVALGYRHYWGNTGIAMQAAWNHVDQWAINDPIDVRVGIIWKF